MTTAIEQPVSSRTSFVMLASDVLSSAGELAKAHGQQLKEEMQAQKQKGTLGMTLLGTGAVLGTLGLIAAMTTLALALQTGLGWGPTASWGTVTALFLILSGGLIMFGLSRLRDLKLVPRETLQSVQESLQWVTHR